MFCYRVDTDGDARLSLKELIDWITLKTKEHFREAVEASKTVFPKVDTDSDGELIAALASAGGGVVGGGGEGGGNGKPTHNMTRLPNAIICFVSSAEL